MRYATIVGLVMILALLAGALPAQAQGGNPAVTDEGSFALVGVATLIWLFLLRWIWRSNGLERFLDVDFGARHLARAPEKGRA